MTTETTATETTPGQHLDKLIADTKQKYDEVNVQMHLAGMEAREQWESLQTKWDEFCESCERVKAAANDSGEAIDASVDTVAKEFHAAFERIAEEIKS